MTEDINATNPTNPGEGAFTSEAASNTYAAPTASAPYAAPSYVQSQTAQIPPAYSVPTYQTAAPMPAPQLTQLTGGQKFGWLVVGFLGSIIGMLLAWLVNIDKAPQVKSDAIKFSVIGFVISIVIQIVIVAFVSFVVMAAATTSYADFLNMMYY